MKILETGRWTDRLPRGAGTAIAAVIIVLLSVAVYAPTFRAGFLWDDDDFVYGNPRVTGEGQLGQIWIGRPKFVYYPVTTTSFWIEWRLWGEWAGGYHAVNVALHALGGLLFWRLLAQLRVAGAWWAAVLFAVHPVEVASVAWVAERKNVLALVFFVGAMMAYTAYLDSRRRRWYAATLGLFAAAVLSKSSAVMLPCVLVVLWWWRGERVSLRRVAELVPLVLLSAAMAATTIYLEQTTAIVQRCPRPEGFLSRLAAAGWAIGFYLGKLVCPTGLQLIYPRWSVDPADAAAWLPLASVAAIAAGLWWNRHPAARHALAALGYFVIMLFPVLGFFDNAYFGISLVADHWQHLASLGVLAGGGAGIAWAAARRHPAARPAVWTAAAAAVAMLGLQARGHCHHFHDMESWARATLAQNPDAWVAYNNLGVALQRNGELAGAVEAYRAGLARRPAQATAWSNLAGVLRSLDDTPGAIRELRQALEVIPGDRRLRHQLGECLVGANDYWAAEQLYGELLADDPQDAVALDQLGCIHLRRQRPAQAVALLEQAVRHAPEEAKYHFDLATALAAAGRPEAASEHYRQSLQLKPGSVEALTNLGALELRRGRLPAAEESFAAAVRQEPGSSRAHYNLATVLARQERNVEALASYRRAVALAPEDLEARLALAALLAHCGHTAPAIAEYREALARQPQRRSARHELAALLGRSGDLAGAIQQCQCLLEGEPDDALAHNNLGAAYLRQGDGPRAAEHFRRALAAQPQLESARRGLEWATTLRR